MHEPEARSLTEIEIERPYIELKSVRTQMIIGFLLVAIIISFAIRDSFSMHPSLLAYLSDSQANELSPFISIGALLIASGALSLFALDTSNFYGSRLGAGASIWLAALVFCLSAQPIIELSAPAPHLVLVLPLVALSMFLDSRFRLLKERWYFWLALASLVLCAILDLGGASLALGGIALSRFFLPYTTGSEGAGTFITRLACGYEGVAILTLITTCVMLNGQTGSIDALPGLLGDIFEASRKNLFLSGITANADGKTIYRSVVIIEIALIIIALVRWCAGWAPFRPLAFAGAWLLFSHLPALSLSAAASGLIDGAISPFLATQGIILAVVMPFSLFLVYFALPLHDASSRRISALFTICGCLLLSALLFFMGQRALDAISSNSSQSRELRSIVDDIERLQKQHANGEKFALCLDGNLFLADIVSNFASGDTALADKLLEALVSDAVSGEREQKSEKSIRTLSWLDGCAVLSASNNERTVNNLWQPDSIPVYRWSRNSRAFIETAASDTASDYNSVKLLDFSKIDLDLSDISADLQSQEVLIVNQAPRWTEAELSVISKNSPYSFLEKNDQGWRLEISGHRPVTVWLPVDGIAWRQSESAELFLDKNCEDIEINLVWRPNRTNREPSEILSTESGAKSNYEFSDCFISGEVKFIEKPKKYELNLADQGAWTIARRSGLAHVGLRFSTPAKNTSVAEFKTIVLKRLELR